MRIPSFQLDRQYLGFGYPSESLHVRCWKIDLTVRFENQGICSNNNFSIRCACSDTWSSWILARIQISEAGYIILCCVSVGYLRLVTYITQSKYRSAAIDIMALILFSSHPHLCGVWFRFEVYLTRLHQGDDPTFDPNDTSRAP